MKRILSISLSGLLLLSIIGGIKSNVYAVEVGWEYCNICQKWESYYYSSHYTPRNCTEDEYIGLHCGHEKLIRPAKEHVFDIANVIDDKIVYYCSGLSNCEATYTELLSEHVCKMFTTGWFDYEPTCIRQGRQGGEMCIGCKTVYDATYTPALGHALVSNNDGKKATCTESGYTNSYYCFRSSCNYKI